jgi:hypothetical protein
MLRDIVNGAMDALRCWQLCNEIGANTLADVHGEWGNLSSAFEKADKVLPISTA